MTLRGTDQASVAPTESLFLFFLFFFFSMHLLLQLKVVAYDSALIQDPPFSQVGSYQSRREGPCGGDASTLSAQ